jgi:hypothetical protein
MTINFRRSGTSSTQDAASVGTGGQAWAKYSVGGNRSNNTWYQNTTGRPIQLAIGLLDDGAKIYIGPSTGSYTTINDSGSDPGEAANCPIVPDDWYYRCQTGSDGDCAREWAEMR